ncbi:MAG: tryptophan 2,3-dioxygenase family protein [Actinomycetota bacterium]|nr:tryptophan 2,3-dioxygenase family protein [Actinomycetota bacterium]
MDDELTYLSYLKVPELLSLQQVRSDPPHPEELAFIVVHQAMELWFKLLLADLERVVAALDRDDWVAALVVLRRVNDVMELGLAHMRTLHAMPPASLHEFRGFLGTASGLQSVQFRELELLSGLREPAYLKALAAVTGGSLPPVLAARLEQRSLAAAHADAGARLGIDDWSAFYADSSDAAAFYLVCEGLVDYDEHWMRWRTEHVTLVERTLGTRTRGTAGTALSYLQRTTRYRYFPHLWALRDELSTRGGGTLVEGHG